MYKDKKDKVEEKEVMKEEKKEIKETKEIEKVKSKTRIVFENVFKCFSNIFEVLLTNKFIQFLIIMFIFYKFGKHFFKDCKVGIFINGTDNFENNYYNYEKKPR